MTDQPRDDHACFRAYVAGHDTPCPGCGYNLRGLTAARCPECNEDLLLGLRLAEPRLGGWLGAVGGAFAGVVGGGAWLIAVAILSIAEGPPPLDRREAWVFVYLPLGAVASCGMVVFRLLRKQGRRRFRALVAWRRVSVIAACWLLTLSWFGAMVAVVCSL